MEKKKDEAEQEKKKREGNSLAIGTVLGLSSCLQRGDNK